MHCINYFERRRYLNEIVKKGWKGRGLIRQPKCSGWTAQLSQGEGSGGVPIQEKGGAPPPKLVQPFKAEYLIMFLQINYEDILFLYITLYISSFLKMRRRIDNYFFSDGGGGGILGFWGKIIFF